MPGSLGTGSEGYLREVFAQSYQACWILAPDGTVLDANEAALAAMGRPWSELSGTRFWEASGWQSSDRLPIDIRVAISAVAAGGFVRFEVDVAKPSSSVTLDLSFKLLVNAAGLPWLILVEGRDVGARARAERALRDSEERFNRIVSIAADAIISMSEEHRVTMFNDGAEKMFGYTESEMIGQPLELLLPTGEGERHAAAVKQFAAGRIDARHMGERREIFGRRKSGEVFRADASISKVTVAGRVVFTAVVRDVTKRWMREEERTKLLDAATRARAEAERERERVAFLAHVTEALNASLDYTESLGTVARLLVPQVATACIVDVVDGHRDVRRVEVVGSLPGSEGAAEFLRGQQLSPDRPYLAKRTIASGQSELIAVVSDDELSSLVPTAEHVAAFRAIGLSSLLCVPLVARGNTLGAIALVRAASLPPFDEAD